MEENAEKFAAASLSTAAEETGSTTEMLVRRDGGLLQQQEDLLAGRLEPEQHHASVAGTSSSMQVCRRGTSPAHHPLQSAMHIIKSFVGLGFLALPYALSQAGWLVCFLAMFLDRMLY